MIFHTSGSQIVEWGYALSTSILRGVINLQIVCSLEDFAPGIALSIYLSLAFASASQLQIDGRSSECTTPVNYFSRRSDFSDFSEATRVFAIEPIDVWSQETQPD
jgi:hypothetical protein